MTDLLLLIRQDNNFRKDTRLSLLQCCYSMQDVHHVTVNDYIEDLLIRLKSVGFKFLKVL
jgi:hypothetical protein